MNLAALSTREMGPGARHLALDDYWSGWNWKKILNMGKFLSWPRALLLIVFSGDYLLRGLLKALHMKSKHTTENKKFDATLKDCLRKDWLAMIRSWESNKSNPNPYTHTEKGSSIFSVALPLAHASLASNFAEVRRKLAEADEEALRRGTASHEVPASIFVRIGLEIEEQQSVVP
jgi:hypothetical protein